MNARTLTDALGGHGSYGVACCPCHEDRDPSLSISDGLAEAEVALIDDPESVYALRRDRRQDPEFVGLTARE